MKKNVFLSAVCLILSVSVFAGGQKDKSGAFSGKLTVWGCFTELQAPLEKARDIFLTENPDADAEVLVFDLRDFEAKVAATAPVGQAADLIVMDHSLTRRYAKAGILEPAPEDLEKMVNSTGRYLEIAPSKASYQGEVMGLPFFGGGPALFYNTDYLNDAGLGKPPETVDETYEYAVKLRKKDAGGKLTRAGYSIRLTGPTGGSQKWAFITNQLLGHDFVEPGSKPDTFHAMLDNPESAEALQWHIGLLHGADKSDDWALKHDAEGFAAGEVAMFPRESWVIPFVEEKGPDINFDVTYMPRDEYWRIYDWLCNACVPASGKNKDIAWTFANVMQRKEVQEVLFKDSGWIPSRRDLDYGDIMSNEPRFEVFVDIPKDAEIYFEVMASSYTELWTKVGEIIQTAYRDDGLLNNMSGCREVVKRAHETANQILESNNEYGE